jgi:hypothetical protein
MLHFEPHTFLILIWTLPFLFIHFIQKKKKIFGIEKKITFIIAILSVVVFIFDFGFHAFFE